MPSWILTASGRRFWPLAPRMSDVDIRDIAHALAAQPRYGGHTRRPYSVAQHAVLVGAALADRHPARRGTAGLIGLLHDASEAYLTDVPRPLKVQPAWAPYREAEARLQRVIYLACGVRDSDWLPFADDLDEADHAIAAAEMAQLLPRPVAPPHASRPVITPWPFLRARRLFLHAYAIYTRARRVEAT